MNTNRYELMLLDTLVAKIDIENGEIIPITPSLMPFDLPIKDINTLADRLTNISSFQDWCSSRVLMMGQKHAKLICNALAISQENSTQNKARLALAYHCSNLMDAYWVKKEGSSLQYMDVSLYKNTSRNILTPVSLKGQFDSVFTKKLKNWSDIGADGTLAKSWAREGHDYYLYKKSDNIDGEILASTILGMFDMDYVHYEKVIEDDVEYTKCKCFTDENTSFVPYHTFTLYHKNNPIEEIRHFIPREYANLAVLTYLLGNEDLHDKNWGLLRDNHTGQILKLAPYFDLDGCFLNYTSSKNLIFLPECQFILKNGETVSALNNDFDFDMDYDIVGLTLEEAALKYVKESTIDFSKIDISIIPNKYKDEFIRRVDLLQEKIKETSKEIDQEDYIRE